ncbi:4a-hydroxytetrahydrobiopterin dehydratase [soil metagenome]
MTALTEMRCVACRPDAPAATPEEIETWLAEVPDWDLIKVQDIPRLRRAFRFPNFEKALEFTNLVGRLAEEEAHHPRITTEWGKVTVAIWTHAIKNLHRNDFILAAKIDQALAEKMETN